MEHRPGKSHLQGLKPSTHVPFSWETNGIHRVYCPPATSRRTWVPLPIPATRRKVPVSSPLCPEVLSACCWFLLRSWVLLPSTEWVHRAVARLSRDPWNCEIPLTPSLGQQPAGPRGQNERWHGDYLPSHWGQDASFETQGYRHPCGQSPNHRPGSRASQPGSSLCCLWWEIQAWWNPLHQPLSLGAVTFIPLWSKGTKGQNSQRGPSPSFAGSNANGLQEMPLQSQAWLSRTRQKLQPSPATTNTPQRTNVWCDGGSIAIPKKRFL